MLSLIATVALMAGTAQSQALAAATIDEQTADFVTADPAEYSLPFVRPRQPDAVWRWIRIQDRVFDDRFAFAEMNGYHDGLLVELDRPCHELWRGSGAVPLFKDAIFQVQGQLCSVKEIYDVPNEAAGRALAISILVRDARDAGEAWPEDPVEAARAFLEAGGKPAEGSDT